MDVLAILDFVRHAFFVSIASALIVPFILYAYGDSSVTLFIEGFCSGFRVGLHDGLASWDECPFNNNPTGKYTKNRFRTSTGNWVISLDPFFLECWTPPHELVALIGYSLGYSTGFAAGHDDAQSCDRRHVHKKGPGCHSLPHLPILVHWCRTGEWCWELFYQKPCATAYLHGFKAGYMHPFDGRHVSDEDELTLVASRLLEWFRRRSTSSATTGDARWCQWFIEGAKAGWRFPKRKEPATDGTVMFQRARPAKIRRSFPSSPVVMAATPNWKAKHARKGRVNNG